MHKYSKHAYWVVAVLFLAAAQINCGNTGSTLPATVAVSQSAHYLFVTQTTQFSASSSQSGATFTWSVNGVAGGNDTVGTIDASGLYTAPAQLTSNLRAVVKAAVTGQPGEYGFASVTVLPSGTVSDTANPLVAQYSLSLPTDAQMSVQFGPDTNYGLTTWSQPSPAGGGTVKILVAGMRQFMTYHMRATLQFPDGTTLVDSDHTFMTGGLPSTRVPQITVTNPNGLTPTGGVEMLHLTAGADKRIQTAAVDNSGNLIWYYDSPPWSVPQPIRLLPNGHILVNLYTAGTGTDGDVREIDLAGNIIRQFTADDLNVWLAQAGYSLQVYQIHHDIIQLPNGHLILLVNHHKDFTDLPGYPGTTSVLGDAVVDLDQNLKPVWVWDSFDHMDVNRHLMAFPDWTHSNALIYTADDGNLLVSMRHQSWIIKIDYEDGRGSGDILWRLGYQGDFTLETGGDPAAWFFAQHYPSIISPNNTGIFDMIVFDDGDFRVLDNSGTQCGIGTAPPCYMRVPIFRVNEAARTASLLWVYSNPPLYCSWGGSAQQIADMREAFGITTLWSSPSDARYMEVTEDPTPQVVLQMDITGQNAYRAVHLPSLYPGVQW